MKVLILAAGQGTRLKPLTDDKPKCMVKINGKSIIQRQIETLRDCGIKEDEIFILSGYKSDILEEYLSDTKVNFIKNFEFQHTNMVYTMMCAEKILNEEEDIILAYGDIVYNKEIIQLLMEKKNNISVIVDDGWYDYWKMRCDNPLDDAETLKFDNEDYLLEIGQKTKDLKDVESQYIGLMKFSPIGIKEVVTFFYEAKRRSLSDELLVKSSGIDYKNMYMTDLLQGLIDEGKKIKAVHINRGWFEIDCKNDLEIAEKYI